jgi:hypothetical protein
MKPSSEKTSIRTHPCLRFAYLCAAIVAALLVVRGWCSAQSTQLASASRMGAPSSNQTQEKKLLFSRDNLYAWCIVPYDSVHRSPEQRAAMLKEIGITSFVWDWRAQHIPILKAEIAALSHEGISLKGVWFWVDGKSGKTIDDANVSILKTLEDTKTHTELWVSFPAEYFAGLPDTQKVQKAVNTIRYIHERAKAIGCSVALYNHGDWFGEPANQVKIIEALGGKDIGIIYNFHHGHQQIDQFGDNLRIMKPYLWSVNLNGMKKEGPMILPIGEGNCELEMLKKLRASGFAGSLGILGHVDDQDVKVVLQKNLEGLKKLLKVMGEEEALRSYR